MGMEGTSGGPTARRYSPEEKARAVRLVRQLREELGTSHGTVQRVAGRSVVGSSRCGQWVKQGDIDQGCRAGCDDGGSQEDP